MNPDPGLLRDELTEIYTEGLATASRARRKHQIAADINRATGISRKQILAGIKTNAAYIGIRTRDWR